MTYSVQNQPYTT